MTRRVNDVFASKFDEALRLDGRTNEQFARDIDYGLRTVLRWRHGDSLPTGEALVCIARALGRDASWFFHEETPNGDDEPIGAAA